jgi:hypothetical protein
MAQATRRSGLDRLGSAQPLPEPVDPFVSMEIIDVRLGRCSVPSLSEPATLLGRRS